MVYADKEPAGFAQFSVGEYFAGENTLTTRVHVLYVHQWVRNYLLGERTALQLVRVIQKWSKRNRLV